MSLKEVNQELPWKPREASALVWAYCFRPETQLPAFISSLEPPIIRVFGRLIFSNIILLFSQKCPEVLHSLQNLTPSRVCILSTLLSYCPSQTLWTWGIKPFTFIVCCYMPLILHRGDFFLATSLTRSAIPTHPLSMSKSPQLSWSSSKAFKNIAVAYVFGWV